MNAARRLMQRSLIDVGAADEIIDTEMVQIHRVRSRLFRIDSRSIHS